MTSALRIRNGSVIDGRGGPPRRADVAIRDGLIVDVADLDGPAVEEIDATGCLVTPGFVDPHTHLDAQLCWDPTASPSNRHGVTSVVIGNCGFGLAPCREGDGEYLLRSLERVEEIPFECSSLGVPFDWTSWGDYLRRIEASGPAVNVGGLVPHSALRYYVMGERGRREAATETDRAALARELRRSLADGALGFATSRGFNHVDGFGDPVPSRAADDDELRALVGECRGRVWQLNVAEKGAHDPGPLLDEVGRYAAWTTAAGARLTWGPFFAEPGEAVWRRVVAFHEELEDRVVWPQVTPLAINTGLRFDGAFPFEAVVGWADALAGFADLSAPDRILRLGEPAVRAALRAAPEVYATPDRTPTGRYEMAPDYARWIIVASVRRPDLVGRSLTSVAADTGADPADVLCDLVVADDLATEIQIPALNRDPLVTANLAIQPATLLGLGDAGAHVTTLASYVYPTDFLARVARDGAHLPVEAAIQRLTSQPARIFGLADRGELRPGWAADVCVIDIERLALGPLRSEPDLPGGRTRLYQDAVGYRAVLVNGEPTVLDDQPTARRPGRALRGR